MWYDGMKFRKANHIAFRNAEEGDIDLEGNEVSKGYVVFVYKSRCPTRPTPGRIYDSEGVEGIPVAYGSNNLAYGRVRNGHYYGHMEYTDARYEYWETYYTTPVYLAYDGLVWMTTLRHKEPFEEMIKSYREKVAYRWQRELFK